MPVDRSGGALHIAFVAIGFCDELRNELIGYERHASAFQRAKVARGRFYAAAGCPEQARAGDAARDRARDPGRSLPSDGSADRSGDMRELLHGFGHVQAAAASRTAASGAGVSRGILGRLAADGCP